MRKSDSEIGRYKVILIGDAGVGKTSIARRQAESVFEFKMNPTVGSSHIKTRLTVNGRLIELMLWDTAGQEQFATLVPLYSRNTDVCIVTASVVNSDSCEHIKTWIKRINDVGEFPPIVIALNKVDMVDDQTLSIDEIREKFGINTEDIFFTSAKTGVGIDQLFLAVAVKAMQQQKIPSGQLTTENLEKKEETENQKSCC